MMLSIVSTNNYNSYNVSIAHLIGLHEAIYLNELINIYEKAERKGKVDNNFFHVDRTYVEERTTLNSDEQKAIQSALKAVGIVDTDGKKNDRVMVNIPVIMELLSSGDTKAINGFVKDLKDQKKVSKRESIIRSLMKNIETPNEELRVAYNEWIESVINKRGYMDKKAVTEGQRVVDEFSCRDLDKALKLISIATINSYVDMTWAVNIFKRDYKSFTKAPTIQNINQLSDEVF